MRMSEIIAAVRKKKRLAYLDDEIIREKINEFLKTHPDVDLGELHKKSAEFKRMVKYARKEFHDIYTVFQTSRTAKREKYLTALKRAVKKADREGIVRVRRDILESHLSTKERMNDFREIYRKIFEAAGRPKKIVDLGSGLNAFSIGLMGLREVEYTAVEISQADCDFINEYFKILSERYDAIKGNAVKIDLEKADEGTLEALDCDVCFAFKLFDLLDNKAVERIINCVHAKSFAVSFSKITVGKKKMKQVRRAGFQKMLRRLDMKYETFETGSELFYVTKK